MFFKTRLFFRQLFGRPLPPEPEFDADRAINDEALRPARDAAQRGDWQLPREVIDDAGVDWELRGRRVSVLSDVAAKNGRWIDAWLTFEPAHPAAALIRASMLNYQAGEARGSASAKNTTAEQFQNFQRLSARAAEAGRRAMELAGPYDPLPWIEMLQTMFADHHARTTLFDEVFAEGRRRDPYNFDLHVTALSLRCQKWYGSHEQMFATAREVAAAAPAGSSSVILPLFAHFEYAMREFSWDTRTDASLKACQNYFRSPEVQQELDQWIAKWQAGAPHPARLSTCRQWTTVYYCLAGRRGEAKAMFDQIGQYVDPSTPWAYFWPGGKYGYLKNWWWANGVTV